jgi:4-hydroxybenzoate polyprenyltransferase
MENNYKIPLCVDLDGTLIKTDSIIETIIIAIRKSPFIIVLLPFWLIRGKNYFKNKIVSFGIPDVTLFPYNQPVIDRILTARTQGRKIILTSASKESIVKAVGEHLNLFDELIYSSDNYNNRSENKVKLLVRKFGERGFDYVGNGYADLPVFAYTNKSILISDNKHLIKKAESISYQFEIIQLNRNNFRNLIKGMRIYQWIKNLLIFLPFILAHQWNNVDIAVTTVIGFLCFSFVASFIYLINDLMDLESDRKHSHKSKRPFASGELSPIIAFATISLPVLASFVISFLYLPVNFGWVLISYFILTCLYSLYLKKLAIIDIITLSVLFTIRILSGAQIGEIYLSKWFLAFSLFLFLSLAIVKRYAELTNLLKRNLTKTSGRGYQTDDMGILLSMGTSSGFISVLIFLFYLFSPEVSKLYQNPFYLIPVSMVLLFWISRMWFLARRGEMNEDPIVFTSKDIFSYFMMLVVIIFLYLAL